MVHLEKKLGHFSLQLPQRGRWWDSMAGAACIWMPLEFICSIGLEVVRNLRPLSSRNSDQCLIYAIIGVHRAAKIYKILTLFKKF